MGFGGTRRWLAWTAMGALAMIAASCTSAAASTGTASAPATKTITLEAAHPYSPTAPTLGTTDDYHCTLVDPHVTTDSMITASEFLPRSPEVHHAILFLVPPAVVAAARAADANGQGWTCFGETPLPGVSLAALSQTPWLAAWAPGHGRDEAPAGTGIPLPAGSLVIMQIHYNMLVGTAPVQSKLVLTTVPAATSDLTPLRLNLIVAPPDVPCPAGVSGPLCDRSASLADLGQRFGQDQVGFVSLIERVCGRDPQDPPAGDSTSCVWPVGFSGSVVRVTAHMHLLGASFKLVLDPGTPQQRTLLDVPSYNFDYQRSYDIPSVSVHPGDSFQVSCTYNPVLRQQLPQLRDLPARFVTWGDGSSDEMCLAIISYVQ